MKKIYILSGARGQGKSTRLAESFGQEDGIDGIVTLRRDGDMRDFVCLASGEAWSMQGPEGGDGPWLEVGRFRFSAAAFQRAEAALRQAAYQHKLRLLLMDEIGPLELRGEGFCEVLKELISLPDGPDLLLVVRSELLADVQQFFEIPDAELIFIEDLPGLGF